MFTCRVDDGVYRVDGTACFDAVKDGWQQVLALVLKSELRSVRMINQRERQSATCASMVW